MKVNNKKMKAKRDVREAAETDAGEEVYGKAGVLRVVPREYPFVINLHRSIQ